MDIDLLKTFLEVSKTKHFGKAADRLFLTQSAVSARIRLLESQLACQLFQRSSKQVYLTEEGRRFAEHAQRIIQSWEQAKQDIAHIQENHELLHIASPALFWQSLFSQRLNKQATSLALSSMDWHSAKDALLSGQLSLFLHEKTDHAELVQSSLGQISLVPCANKATVKNTSNQMLQYIAVNWGEAFQQFSERYIYPKYPISFKADLIDTILQLLATQNTFAFLPAALAQNNSKLTVLSLEKIPQCKIQLAAYYLPNQRDTNSLQQIIDTFALR